MSTSWTTEILNDYLDDRLNASDRAALESALSEDAQAADALRDLQLVREQLCSAPRFSLGPEFAARVVAALPAATEFLEGEPPESKIDDRPVSTGPRSVRNWRTTAAVITTLAASLLLITIASPWLLPRFQAVENVDPAPALQSDSIPAEGPANAEMPIATNEHDSGEFGSDLMKKEWAAGIAAGGLDEQPKASALADVLQGDEKSVAPPTDSEMPREQPKLADMPRAAPSGGAVTDRQPAQRAETAQAGEEMNEAGQALADNAPSRNRSMRRGVGQTGEKELEGESERGRKAGNPIGMDPFDNAIAENQAAPQFHQILRIETTAEDWQLAGRYLASPGSVGRLDPHARDVPGSQFLRKTSDDSMDSDAAESGGDGAMDDADGLNSDAAIFNMLAGQGRQLVEIETTPEHMDRFLGQIRGIQTELPGSLDDYRQDSGDEAAPGGRGGGGGGFAGGQSKPAEEADASMSDGPGAPARASEITNWYESADGSIRWRLHPGQRLQLADKSFDQSRKTVGREDGEGRTENQEQSGTLDEESKSKKDAVRLRYLVVLEIAEEAPVAPAADASDR